MKRRLLAGLMALVATAATGCGVTFDSGVQVDGAGPSYGPGGNPAAPRSLPQRTESTDPIDLVDNFLKSVASDPADRKRALAHANTFLSEKAQENWNPTDEINVVRVLDKVQRLHGENVRVELRVKHLGVLTANGRIEEPVATTTEYVFEVGRSSEADGRFLVKSPPSDLLLSQEGLRDYFTERPLYFWNAEGTALLPDLRYVASVDKPEVMNRLVEWLLEGPAPWLRSVAQELPRTKLESNVLVDDKGRTVVDISQPAESGDWAKLHQQLSWTLDPGYAGLVLRVAGRDKRSGGISRQIDPVNPSALQRSTSPLRYGIADGKLYRLESPALTDEPPAIPIDESVNSKLLSAAVSVFDHGDDHGLRGRFTERAFALVRQDGAKQRLWIGPSQKVRPTTMLRQHISQAVWLDHEDEAVVVLADERLYYVNSRDGAFSEIDVPQLRDGVQSFAIAPDGHRIALIAGGKLYLAGLRRGGNVPAVSQPRTVATTLSELQAVGFSQENWVVIAGRDGNRVRLIEITTDGAKQRQIGSDLNVDAQITHLVVYTDNPTDGQHPGHIMMVLDGQGVQPFSAAPGPLSELLVVPASAPSPAGESPAPSDRPSNVIAPSYQG